MHNLQSSLLLLARLVFLIHNRIDIHVRLHINVLMSTSAPIRVLALTRLLSLTAKVQWRDKCSQLEKAPPALNVMTRVIALFLDLLIPSSRLVLLSSLHSESPALFSHSQIASLKDPFFNFQSPAHEPHLTTSPT